MIKNLKMALIIGVFCSGLGNSFAYGKKGRGFTSILKQLNLTEEQKKQIKSIAGKDKVKSLKNEIRDKKKKLLKEFMGKKSDKELLGMNKELQGLRSQMDDLLFEKRLKVRNILTAKQKSEFLKIQEKKMNEKKMGMKKKLDDKKK